MCPEGAGFIKSNLLGLKLKVGYLSKFSIFKAFTAGELDDVVRVCNTFSVTKDKITFNLCNL